MNNIINLILFLSLTTPISAQSISDIKSSSTAINGRMSNSYYRHDSQQFKKLRDLLRLNVFDYFGLSEKYDTELKRKVYRESQDYSSKQKDMENKRLNLYKSTFYLDFEPTYYERNNLVQYDLKSQMFTVKNEIYSDYFYNEPNYIQFDQIIIKTPKGITVDRSQINSGGVNFIRQRINFKVEDESLALKIEENRSYLKLLFVFKFTEAKAFQGLNFFGRKITVFALANELSQVIVYNSRTEEIYKIFN